LEDTNPMFKRDAFMKATKMNNKGIPTVKDK